MTQPRYGFILLTFVATALASGCGSCQRAGEEATTTGAPQAPAPAPTKAAPAATPAAAAPATSPAAAPAAEAHSDCFVFVDAEPDLGDAPLESHFTTELECGDKPVTYSWDFGDGTKGGNEANPVHSYQRPGDYVATVTVATADGETGSDEIDIFVDEPEQK